MVRLKKIFQNLRHKTAGRFILLILLFSSIITCIGTGVQLYTDYFKDMEFIRNTFRQIDVSYRQSITNALWVSNMETLKIHLQGIVKFRDMQYVEVELEDGSFIRAGEKTETRHILHQEYTMSYPFGGREIYLGKMQVTASLRGVYRRLLDKVLVILLVQTAKTFIVSFFIFYLFYILVGRHLFAIASYLGKFDLNRMDQPLRLKGYSEKTDEKNEFSILMRSFNDMRMNLIEEIKLRDRAEASLRESEESYRSLITEMSAGFALHDVIRKEDGTPYDYRFVEVNAAFERVTGFERKRIIGQTLLGLVPEPEQQWIDAYSELALTGKPVTFEGYSRKLEKHVHLIAYSPRKGRFAAILQDISERKRVEEELEKYRKHLEEMVDERTAELRDAREKLLAAERFAILGKFAGSVSHELRNPLAVIDSSVYYLKNKLDAGDQKIMTHLDRITKQVKHSADIIESLLNLTRMRPPHKEDFDPADLLDDVLSELKIPETIRIDTKKQERVRVFGDFRQLYLAIKNILTNAVDAMNGEGILTMKTGISEDGKYAEILIRDTGPGIHPEHTTEIFKPLFSTKAQGIGLGLAICQQILDQHEGSIDVVSEPGKGSRFIIRLPIHG